MLRQIVEPADPARPPTHLRSRLRTAGPGDTAENSLSGDAGDDALWAAGGSIMVISS